MESWLVPLSQDTGRSRIAHPPGCCKVSDKNGDPGGCKEQPPCVEKFCISELNAHDLVHTFYQHYIENLFIYFQ